MGWVWLGEWLDVSFMVEYNPGSTLLMINRIEKRKKNIIRGNKNSMTSQPAMDGDWSVLTELFLGLVHLANEVDEALATFGHTLFRPISELELPHRA